MRLAGWRTPSNLALESRCAAKFAQHAQRSRERARLRRTLCVSEIFKESRDNIRAQEKSGSSSQAFLLVVAQSLLTE